MPALPALEDMQRCSYKADGAVHGLPEERCSHENRSAALSQASKRLPRGPFSQLSLYESVWHSSADPKISFDARQSTSSDQLGKNS